MGRAPGEHGVFSEFLGGCSSLLTRAAVRRRLRLSSATARMGSSVMGGQGGGGGGGAAGSVGGRWNSTCWRTWAWTMRIRSAVMSMISFRTCRCDWVLDGAWLGCDTSSMRRIRTKREHRVKLRCKRWVKTDGREKLRRERGAMPKRIAPYSRMGWWAVTVSNRRPSRCKRDALPTELTAH